MPERPHEPTVSALLNDTLRRLRAIERHRHPSQDISGVEIREVIASSVAGTTRFKSGYYYLPSSMGSLSGVLGTPELDLLNVLPFIVDSPGPTSFQALGIHYQNSNVASMKLRLGIYADTGEGSPGALILDAGQLDLSVGAIANPKMLTIAEILTPGVYWFGGAAQGATGSTSTVYVTPQSGHPQPLPLGHASVVTTSVPPVWGYSLTGVSGALPDPFGTPTGTITAITLIPAFIIQVA